MSEFRLVHEVPVHILQEFIVLIRANEKYIGEGKVGTSYYLYKSEKQATIIYDNRKIAYVANLVRDDNNNWFFVDKIAIRDSLNLYITEEEVSEDKKEEGK